MSKGLDINSEQEDEVGQCSAQSVKTVTMMEYD